MKSSVLLLAAACLSLGILTGCHPGPGPREVASRFLQAVLNSNFTEAKKYATPESESMLTALASLTDALPPAERENIHHSKITIRQVRVKGNIARVTYLNSSEIKPETLILTKSDGEWKVAFTKDYIMPRLEGPGADSLSGNTILPDTIPPENKPGSSR